MSLFQLMCYIAQVLTARSQVEMLGLQMKILLFVISSSPNTNIRPFVGRQNMLLVLLQECQFSTPLKQTLKLHISREHREKQLECLDCHEKFGPLIDLKTHIRETGELGLITLPRTSIFWQNYVLI